MADTLIGGELERRKCKASRPLSLTFPNTYTFASVFFGE